MSSVRSCYWISRIEARYCGFSNGPVSVTHCNSTDQMINSHSSEARRDCIQCSHPGEEQED